MDFQTQYITPDIKLSRYEGKLFKTEVVFGQHMLVWFLSGETKIIQADAQHIFRAGDIFLIPKNQLATIVNYPKDGPHQSVVMHLSDEKLRDFYKELDVKPKVSAQKIRKFNDHPLLQSCLASLVPYFEIRQSFPENIADLKIREAISILRTIDPNIDEMLANFELPGRIDLAGFMEKHFMFNLTLERFGYLTGRSLTTFKRDFKKAFNTTPQKWLTRKRLERAHYELRKKRKPAEVYLETGFENLSHFSFAFKKEFGYPPTQLPTL